MKKTKRHAPKLDTASPAEDGLVHQRSKLSEIDVCLLLVAMTLFILFGFELLTGSLF